MRLLIYGGRVVDPASGVDAVMDVLIEDGRVVSVGPNLDAGPDAVRLGAEGLVVVPGLIDMHVHLREPGHEYKETIATGTRAAAAGGFTAVACMPNTDPVNDCQAVTRYIIEKAAREGLTRVYPVGAVSKGQQGKELTEFGELKSVGAVAVSDDGRGVKSGSLMRRAMEYGRQCGLAVISHCEDESLSRGGTMHEGAVSTRLGLRGIPSVSEEAHVFRETSLSGLTGCPVHIAHVSCRGSVDIIRRAKQKGLLVTAETCPHYLTLTDQAVDGYNTNAKMNPPLRTAGDVAALKKGLNEGVIDVIATDHAPHSVLEKDVEFDVASFGVVGLETALALTLRLVREGVIDLGRAISALSAAPARILGVEGGILAVGSVADVTVIDLNAPVVVDRHQFESRASNSPFDGWRLLGRAVYTIVGGEVVWPVDFGSTSAGIGY